MELPYVGQSCNVKECNQLDFLPIKCPHCLKNYCKFHNLPDQHRCSIKPEACIENVVSQHVKYVCSLPNCNEYNLTPIDCPCCLEHFCLKHRHQVDHNCSKYSPPSNPMAEAGIKIQELVAQLPTEPKKLKKVKDEKLAAKVQLMKLKGKAVGGMQLPAEEKIFFSISLPKKFSGKYPNPLAVCVSHHWTLGRVLDNIAELAKVPNHNHEGKSPWLSLYRASDGTLLGPLDNSLKDLIDLQNIYSGQTLILEYGEKTTNHLEDFETYTK